MFRKDINIFYDALEKSDSLAVAKILNDKKEYTASKLNATDNWWIVDNQTLSEDSQYNIINDLGDRVIEGNVKHIPLSTDKIEAAGI